METYIFKIAYTHYCQDGTPIPWSHTHKVTRVNSYEEAFDFVNSDAAARITGPYKITLIKHIHHRF